VIEPSPPLLEGRGLTVWRGENLLLDGLDLSVRAGEVLQLAGPNGSGKSTLLRALVGLAELDEGEVYWQGRATRRVRESFHGELLYLGHKPGISGGLDPRENLRALLGPEADDTVRMTAALEELGLGTRLDVPCRSLSAGQQRRVALTRLRLQPRRLWLLDEPLTALDAAGLDWVRTRIVERAQAGGAVVYTTHQSLALDGVTARVLTLGDPAGVVT